MNEWLSLDAAAALPWRPLAVEALELVRAARGRGPLTGPIGSPCPAC